MMRLFGAVLSLSLVVGLAAASRPGGLPGRDVAAGEASEIIGGDCATGQETNCDSNCGIGKAIAPCMVRISTGNNGCATNCQTSNVIPGGCGG